MDARHIETILNLFKRKRKFNYVQIGISSRCFLSCAMCPRTCFPDQWNSTDMTLETYRTVALFFPYAQNVYLSGWGEPLLNPHFREMVQMAKVAGCSVGFTTNGALLDDAMIGEIIRLKTDLVSVSLAGATAETHESRRVGSSFKDLTRKIRSMTDTKKEMGSDNPQIILLFMMTRENMGELPLSVELAAEVGADGVVATNLDYVAVPLQEELRAFSCDGTNQWFVECVREAVERARDEKVSFHAFPLEMRPIPVWGEDPLNSIYLSEDGYVSPCVYLNLPMKKIPRLFCGEKTTIPRVSFGNINERSLFEIWNSQKYTIFRKKYEHRIRRTSSECNYGLPEICRTCYKAYGI